jgi:hypothetical protein
VVEQPAAEETNPKQLMEAKDAEIFPKALKVQRTVNPI